MEQGELWERSCSPEALRFEVWHQQNPEVYRLFKRFAGEGIRAGRKHLGTNMIIERIRWYSAVETTGDIYKINNNFAPYYARMFMKDFPQYDGFFRTRKSKADGEEE